MNRSVTANLLPQGKKIAIVQASWHSDIVAQASLAFTAKLSTMANLSDSDFATFKVPGSLEIPLQCQRLARSGNYHVIVAAGLIVDGGIYRHEFVAATVLDAMMQVQLDTDVPILSVVLTPQKFDENDQKDTDYFYQHFKIKGEEAADACYQVLQNSLSMVNEKQ